MDQRLSPTPPPAYGSVANQPGQDAPTTPLVPPPAAAAGYAGTEYPQPGGYPAGAAPNEPPPKYEPSKEVPQSTPAGQYPPAGYQPGYQAGYPVAQTVIVAQDMGWSSNPKITQCPRCRAIVTSGIEHKAGGITWLASGLICLFGCWLGCCLIPFCMPELQDVEHKCPNCNYVMGVYHRM